MERASIPELAVKFYKESGNKTEKKGNLFRKTPHKIFLQAVSTRMMRNKEFSSLSNETNKQNKHGNQEEESQFNNDLYQRLIDSLSISCYS